MSLSIAKCLEWSIVHGPSIGLQGLMRPAQTLPLFSHAEKCICKPWIVLTNSQNYIMKGCCILRKYTKSFNGLKQILAACHHFASICGSCQSISSTSNVICHSGTSRTSNQIYHLLHHQKLKCPLKRDHFKRKFHLQTKAQGLESLHSSCIEMYSDIASAISGPVG